MALSGSVALLGDTIHNGADALTALPLGIAFVLGRRAANRRYTYGYGRAEDLAGIAIVLTIAASSALAAYEAVDRLLNPRDITHLWAVAIAALVGFAGNECVARYRITTGRRIGSAALVADGLHAPHRRLHLFRSPPGRRGCWARLALGRPRRRPPHHRRDPDWCCAMPPARSTGG
nr:hypothetical protein StreXyl84_00190 [Streptomyces sp. Xyl84]